MRPNSPALLRALLSIRTVTMTVLMFMLAVPAAWAQPHLDMEVEGHHHVHFATCDSAQTQLRACEHSPWAVIIDAHAHLVDPSARLTLGLNHEARNLAQGLQFRLGLEVWLANLHLQDFDLDQHAIALMGGVEYTTTTWRVAASVAPSAEFGDGLPRVRYDATGEVALTADTHWSMFAQVEGTANPAASGDSVSVTGGPCWNALDDFGLCLTVGAKRLTVVLDKGMTDSEWAPTVGVRLVYGGHTIKRHNADEEEANEEGQPVELLRIPFEKGSAQLDPKYVGYVERIGRMLQTQWRMWEGRVHIHGHADGPQNGINHELAFARAYALLAPLVKGGIDRERIAPFGYVLPPDQARSAFNRGRYVAVYVTAHTEEDARELVEMAHDILNAPPTDSGQPYMEAEEAPLPD